MMGSINIYSKELTSNLYNLNKNKALEIIYLVRYNDYAVTSNNVNLLCL